MLFRRMATIALPYMSEAVEPTIADTLERQNRFISDNLRRIFLLVYRMVGNVADAQDLTQEVFIKALQRQEQQHRKGGPLAVAHRHQHGH